MGDKWQRTGNSFDLHWSSLIDFLIKGYCGLGRAVTSLKLNTSQDVEVDFVASSLGSVNMDLLSAIYHAAQGQFHSPFLRPVLRLTRTGDNGMKEYDMRSAKARKNKLPAGVQSTLDNKFRIYFPSRDTVIHSRGGENVSIRSLGRLEIWTELSVIV